MFNFKELKLDKRTDSNNLDPFIGIRRNKNGEIEFRLPLGFKDFPEGDFNATKQLFFKMYRAFKKFERDHLKEFQDTQPRGKDNIEVGSNAYQFKDKEGNSVLLYSKIGVIENVLEAYQDLALNIIERRIGRNEDIDFSKIDCYLHKAIYLPDDVIYVEEMDLARHTLQYESANLIELFCFILAELQQELEETIDIRVNELANKFREQHLTHDQSLFNEETFETTISFLKEILDDIDKKTAYKDDDYWQLYEAVEAFLYGELDMENTNEDGIFWGINNFYKIWENMCNTYAFKNFNDIVYADTNVIISGKRVDNCTIGGYRIFCKDNFENPFFVEFRGEKRWMRPDLIRVIEISPMDNIEINIIKDTHGRIDFTVKQKKHEIAKDIYDKFVYLLKKSLREVRGAAFRNNKFINYTKERLELYKKDFIKKELIILDWKYHDCSSFIYDNKRIRQDIVKQLAYEFALHQDHLGRIKSQFVIPFFYKVKDDIGDFIEDNLLIEDLKENGIKVFKADFIKIQQVYLAEL